MISAGYNNFAISRWVSFCLWYCVVGPHVLVKAMPSGWEPIISDKGQWITAPGYVDLSPVSFRKERYSQYEKPLFFGVLVTPFDKESIPGMNCCSDRSLECSAKNEPFVMVRSISENGEKLEASTFLWFQVNDTQYMEVNPDRIDITKSGNYMVQFGVCGGSDGYYEYVPSGVETQGLYQSRFISINGGYLHPSMRLIMWWSGFVACCYGLLTCKLLSRAGTASKPQLFKLVCALSAVTGMEASFVFCWFLYMDQTYTTEPERSFLVYCFSTMRVFRIGLIAMNVLSLAFGSEIFRRGPFQEPCILVTGIVVMVAVTFAYANRTNDPLLIAAYLVCRLGTAMATLAAIVKSWQHLMHSTSISEDYVSLYRRTILGLLLYGLMLPGIFYLYFPEDFSGDYERPFPGWRTAAFWQLNTFWFCCWYAFQSHQGATRAATTPPAEEMEIAPTSVQRDTINESTPLMTVVSESNDTL